jgi:large repetitive protein
MKKLYPRIVFTLIILSMIFTSAVAQNVFDINDKDSIFGTVLPPLPAWGRINKWGHAKRLTNWGGTGTTTYKAYYYDQMPFRLKFPKSYQQGVADGKTYPIYIFFHGAGESGNAYDNEYQMFWGGQTWRDNVDNGKFDGFLFYDQSTNGYHTNYFAAITNILDSLAKYCKLDINRVIIDGLSSGGQSSWDFLGAYPKYLAAGMPISAARTDYYATIPNYLHIPLWLFNGGLDRNPDPIMAQSLVDSITHLGGYIKHTLYPNLGHGVWNNAWADTGFIPFMLAAYKSNPLVYFQKTNFCPGTTISAKLGLTAGFFAYQWMKDGVIIPGATSNTYTATQLGTYSARFQRVNGGPWSDWSHTPAVITSNAVSPSPNIQVQGLESIVLPAPDGSTTVPLMEPDGYVSYTWKRVSDNVTVGTQSVFNAPPGTYTATTVAPNSCSSSPSLPFTVVSANGPNKPDPAANLTAIANSQTSVALNWSKNPNPTVSETGFEIYRSQTSGGPYALITIRPKDTVTYQDNGLISNTVYYYIVRAVNNTGAASNSNEAFVKTLVDNTAPTAPSNLKVLGSSGTSISFSWTASTDNVGVTSYDIYVNGKKAYTVQGNQTSFSIFNLVHDQVYDLQVKAKDAAGNASTFSNSVAAAAIYSGLTYQYYQGAYTTLPNFNNITPVSTGVTPNVSLAPAQQGTNYAFLWQGYINIRKAGTYTFETNSDDGSKVWIGNAIYDPNQTPVVNNDGVHTARSRTGNITLAVGYYPINIAYFQGTTTSSVMQLFWTSTTNGISRSQVPDSAFVESFNMPGTVPAAPSNLKANAVAYNKVNLTWSDNSNNETGFELYRATSNSGPFTTIVTTGAGIVSYIDSSVAPSTTYFYKIRAIGTYGQSSFDAIGTGTQYLYYNTATALSLLPNFNTMTPASSGIWPNFTLGMQTQSTNFAAKFDSYIKITTAGSYTFSTNSDDGSALYINGTQVVNNDGAHGAQTRTGNITLAVGTYPISVTFFQGGGGFALTASYSGPGVVNQQIPTSVLGQAFATATTPALPPPPGAPVSVHATTLDNSSVNISWQYAGSDATSFQLYRATGSNNNYRIIATVSNPGGTSFNYKDSSLFENVLYYYKINAVGAGGTGPYSNYDSARTALSNPVITPIADFTMRYDTKDTVAVNVKFSSSVTVAITAINNLPTFAAITDNGNGTGSIIFSPGSADQGNYQTIVIKASASNGGFTTDTFNVVVNSNHPPVLNSIPPANFDEGTKDTLTLSATDQDGLAGLTWSATNLPVFASLVNNNDGTASLILAPTYISHGSYTIPITVSDPQGGTSIKSLLLTINKKNPNQQYLIRTQYTAPVAAPWNNMTGPSISNIINATTGQPSTLSVNFTPSTWWNTYNQGPQTGNNSGVYPDNVLKEYFYFGFNGGPDLVTNTITGLKPGGRYNFKFYAGSASPYVADAGTTVYTIGAQSASLYVQNNTKNTANLNNIIADGTGTVVVGMSKASDGTPAGFLNAMEIDYIYDDSTAPAKPTDLAATLLQGTGVQLTWTDIAYNAQQYFVYRATDTTGTYTLLNPAANDGNAASYVDSTAAGHTTYYYKIKASNNYGDLGFTNNVSITTAAKNPTISSISNTTVKANATGNIAFTATGDQGASVTVSASLPGFALLQNLGSGNYNIIITPNSSNTGVYNASVTALDNFGASITTQFQIFVIENNVSSVYLHFGTDTSIAKQPWNNLLGYPFQNTTVSNLKRADGTNSGITLTLLDQWSSPPNDYGMVTGDNTGIFPDVVMRSSLVETTTTPRRIKLSGLDASKFYNIVVFSSANNGQKGTSTFKIGAQTLVHDAAYNTNKTVQFNGQQPDGTGAITLTFTKDAASVYGYLNAIIIQSYDTAIVPIVSPNFVFVEPVHTSKTSLKIVWADRSYNETGIEVWRSNSMNGSYSLVTTLAAGATSYNDQGLTPNTQYFYKIRAVNSSVQSDYSSVAYATTPNAIVLEHLTWNYREGLRPWNNSGVNAQIGDVYGNLKDDQWNNTGISIGVVDGPFEGETNTGVVSGNNSSIFPDTVMMGAFYVQLGSQTAVLKYSNLDQTKKYRIGFEGSTVVNLDMTGVMTINGVSKYLNAYSNTTKVVYFDGVSPDQNGEIYMTFDAKGQYGVLGALVLMSYTDYGNTNMGSGGGGGTNGIVVNSVLAGQTPELDSAELQHFIAYPNPFRSGFTLGFDNIYGVNKIEIEVYNMSGQLIFAKDEGYALPGSNNFSINLSPNTPTGVYIAVLKSDKKILKLFKVVKAK